MTLSEIAAAVGATKQTVWAWTQRGCPTSSLDAVVAWTAANLRKRGRPRGKKMPPRQAATPKPAAVKKAAPAPRNGENGNGTHAFDPTDPHRSVTAVLARVSDIEVLAYGAVTKAVETMSPAAGQAVTTYRDCVRSFVALRGELLSLQQQEAQLVPAHAVRELVTKHDAVIIAALQGMPRSLAGQLTPHDPAPTEKILSDWANQLIARIKGSAVS